MSTDEQLLVIWQTAEHATCTRHRTYALTCEQWDGILRRAAGKCEICGADGRDLAWGRLHIDHEHHLGQWAVRGLLCDACNYRLRRDRRIPETEAIRRYLENSWYRGELEAAGLDAETPSEPGVGSEAAIFGRHWMRFERFWECERGSQTTLRQWPELWRTYGPLHIEITAERTAVPEWVKRISGYAFRYRHPELYRAKTKKSPPQPSRDTLEVRIARALAVVNGRDWHAEDQAAVAELAAILTLPGLAAELEATA